MGGNAEWAEQISNNVDQGLIQATMGQELIWLSEVIPKCAEGDWKDFINTGTTLRKQSLEFIKILDSILGSEDPAVMGMYKNTLITYEPSSIYQTALMVIWVLADSPVFQNDRDSDRVLDIDDECPDLPGFDQYNGCPDLDGVYDRPDLDSDGIDDKEDR